VLLHTILARILNQENVGCHILKIERRHLERETKIRPMDLECALKWYARTLIHLKNDPEINQTGICHRIGHFLATLARFCAR